MMKLPGAARLIADERIVNKEFDMPTGKIVQLFRDKEYGLIEASDGAEVHFHSKCLRDVRFDELSEGQAVEFLMQITHKGLLGFEIRPAGLSSERIPAPSHS